MITISVFGLYADGYPNASINLEHRHTNHNHNYIVPVDMPDVYYDNVNHTIIIDGGGEVSHYDVEIAPVSLQNVDTVSPKHVPVTQNLLGEPEFELWTDIPQQYSNISITRSDNSISISGISSDSTIVAVYNNGGQMGKTIVRDTDISLNANPNSTIMLYKHNHIPYIAPLELQNITFSKNQYVIANDVIAGKFVNSNRTPGNVVVKSGIEYEIESSGTVTLQDGFKVEKGATFAVYPSSF